MTIDIDIIRECLFWFAIIDLIFGTVGIFRKRFLEGLEIRLRYLASREFWTNTVLPFCQRFSRWFFERWATVSDFMDEQLDIMQEGDSIFDTIMRYETRRKVIITITFNMLILLLDAGLIYVFIYAANTVHQSLVLLLLIFGIFLTCLILYSYREVLKAKKSKGVLSLITHLITMVILFPVMFAGMGLFLGILILIVVLSLIPYCFGVVALALIWFLLWPYALADKLGARWNETGLTILFYLLGILALIVERVIAISA